MSTPAAFPFAGGFLLPAHNGSALVTVFASVRARHKHRPTLGAGPRPSSVEQGGPQYSVLASLERCRREADVPFQRGRRDSREAAQGVQPLVRSVATQTARTFASPGRSLAERTIHGRRPCIEVRPCFAAGFYQYNYSSRKRLFDGIQSFANSSAFSSQRLILFSGETLSPQYSTNRASSIRRAASLISASINLSARSI